MNDNNSKKNRPKSQIMLPNSTSPLPPHSRKNGSSDSLPNHRYENEWEVRSKELAEAKTRVAQMEKTMRWWSDCTDNWRKKWSEVKTERNELRKELRITKNQMGKLMKSLSPRMQAGETLLLAMGTEPVSGIKNNGFPIYGNTTHGSLAQSGPASSSKVPYHHSGSSSTAQPFPMSRNAQTQTTVFCSSQLSVIDKEIVGLLEEKVAHLTTKLDEVNRRFIMERDEKAHLHVTIERLRRDFSDLHELYESLKKELCDINGKEFTESEVESYAEEETEEARLLEQLAQDGDDAEELEEDEFDGEQETEVDKHTPTAEIQSLEPQGCSNGSENADPVQGSGEVPSQVGTSSEKLQDEVEKAQAISIAGPILTDSAYKQDLAASIQVEISEVHRKLDLKTFISDVTELVGGVPGGQVIQEGNHGDVPKEKVDKVSVSSSSENIAESMLNTLEVFLENQNSGNGESIPGVRNGNVEQENSGTSACVTTKLVSPDPSQSPPPLPDKSPPSSPGQDQITVDEKLCQGNSELELGPAGINGNLITNSTNN